MWKDVLWRLLLLLHGCWQLLVAHRILRSCRMLIDSRRRGSTWIGGENVLNDLLHEAGLCVCRITHEATSSSSLRDVVVLLGHGVDVRLGGILTHSSTRRTAG